MRVGGAPKPWGRLKRAYPNCVKFYESGARRGPAAAKMKQLQAEVVGGAILRLMANARYFTGSVSWVTDFVPYLPQYVAGHYEEKTTQVSAAGFIQWNTWDSRRYARINEAIPLQTSRMTSALL